MKNYRALLFALLTGLLIVSACNKEQEVVTNKDVMVESAIKAMVAATNNEYLQVVVPETSPYAEFQIPNLGMITQYLADDAMLSARNVKPDHRMIVCLKKLTLTDDQTALVRRAMFGFKLRNQELIKRHQQVILDLKARFEKQRKDLLAKKEAGEITEEVFKQKVKELRLQLQAELKKVKEMFAGKFSGNFKFFLDKLSNILTQEQFIALKECMVG